MLRTHVSELLPLRLLALLLNLRVALTNQHTVITGELGQTFWRKALMLIHQRHAVPCRPLCAQHKHNCVPYSDWHTPSLQLMLIEPRVLKPESLVVLFSRTHVEPLHYFDGFFTSNLQDHLPAATHYVKGFGRLTGSPLIHTLKAFIHYLYWFSKLEIGYLCKRPVRI